MNTNDKVITELKEIRRAIIKGFACLGGLIVLCAAVLVKAVA